MASRGQSLVLCFWAYDTSAKTGKTGDSANITLYYVKDGTASPATNAVAEVDATNLPGLYKVTLTAAECTADTGTIGGKSSTANVVIQPVTVTFEQLPTAVPAASGGLLTYGTGTGQINPASGNVTVAGYATGQVPLQPTVAGRTLDVSTTGEAGIDWANVGSPTTTVALTGTTIASTQKVDVETIKTQAVTCAAGVTVGAFVGNATAALAVDISGRVTVGSNADKTGYALTQAFPANFAALAITVGGAVTAGTVSDKTGYSLTQTFPANFADLAITVTTGRVTVGTNADKAGYSVSGTLTTLDALDTSLSSTHGAGSWATAVGFAVPGSAMNLADGAITEAKITAPAEAAGRPTGVLGMLRRVFEWTCNKRTRDRTTGDVVLRNATDSATLETQTQGTVGSTDTQTKGV